MPGGNGRVALCLKKEAGKTVERSLCSGHRDISQGKRATSRKVGASSWIPQVWKREGLSRHLSWPSRRRDDGSKVLKKQEQTRTEHASHPQATKDANSSLGEGGQETRVEAGSAWI